MYGYAVYVFTCIKNLFVIAALGAFGKSVILAAVKFRVFPLPPPFCLSIRTASLQPSAVVGQREGVKPSMWQSGQVGNKRAEGSRVSPVTGWNS